VRDARFRLSQKTFSLYDRPDRRGEFQWAEEDAGGARVAVCVGMNQWVEREALGPWALLRIIHSGDPKPSGASGMFECKWNIEANVLGRVESFQVGILFEPSQQNDLFKETFFERFACPPKVGP
jgi:type VI protein secretion system component VasK